MKKDIKKKFFLAAMVASLVLLWGGVTSCSNGSDDDGNENWDGTPPSAVMLQGHTDKDKTWKDDLAEMTKSTEGEIWTAELTLSDQQWPNFGIKATANEKDFYFKGDSNGTEVQLGEETKATENGAGNIWCDVGEENKNANISVTVDFSDKTAPTIKIEVKQDENEGTPTTPEGDGDNGGTGEATGNESKEISFKGDEALSVLAANKVSESTKSITITITDITGTTTDESWWFWAKTDGDKGDSIAWKEKIKEKDVYQLTINDSTKIEYIKKNGLYIKGSDGLSAKVTVTWE